MQNLTSNPLRHFYVVYVFLNGTGQITYNSTEYPNKVKLMEELKEIAGNNVIITNIIELSEEDYNSFKS